MDFKEFINSSDIREHLEKIGYEFNSIEAAWLVWQSKAPVRRRHRGLEYILDAMPDMSIKEYNDHSLHTVVRDYLNIERAWLDEWFSGDDVSKDGFLTDDEKRVVYRIEGLTNEGRWEKIGPPYSTPAMARDHILKKEPRGKYSSYVICREHVKWDGKKIYVCFDPDGEPMSVYCDRFDCKDDFVIYSVLFQQIHLVFPVPFKTGDVLSGCGTIGAPGLYEDVFVYTHITNDSSSLESGHSNEYDTVTHGYFLTDSDEIRVVEDGVWGYMDLEYYRGELTGRYAALDIFSRYAKGEIDENTLCTSYKKVISGGDDYSVTYYTAL